MEMSNIENKSWWKVDRLNASPYFLNIIVIKKYKIICFFICNEHIGVKAPLKYLNIED